MDSSPFQAYETKYAEQIRTQNSYRLFLSIKTDLRKTGKKDIKEFFTLLTFGMTILKEFNEVESRISLMTYALTEYQKLFVPKDQDLFLETFRNCLLLLPEKGEKAVFKYDFLKFCESKQINDVRLQKYDIYKIFAKDSLESNEIVEGYRYALKSQDSSTITTYCDLFIKSQEITGEIEQNYFRARIVLELILLNNLNAAIGFISQFVDANNDYQNNSPIMNFAFLLPSLISQNMTSFDGFWSLINIYKNEIDKEPFFAKYLNKISVMYYNKPFLKEEGGFNIMSLLKSFS